VRSISTISFLDEALHSVADAEAGRFHAEILVDVHAAAVDEVVHRRLGERFVFAAEPEERPGGVARKPDRAPAARLRPRP
jgi:hypothetical protein